MFFSPLKSLFINRSTCNVLIILNYIVFLQCTVRLYTQIVMPLCYTLTVLAIELHDMATLKLTSFSTRDLTQFKLRTCSKRKRAVIIKKCGVCYILVAVQ